MLNWLTEAIENALDFSNVLNISITASWVVLAVVLARLALKKAPKWIHVALWGIVAIRLLLPFSIESVFSLIPSKETVPSDLMQAQGTQLHESAHVDIVSNPHFPGNVSFELSQSTDRVQIAMMLMTFVWIAGIAAMLTYTAASYIRLRRKVETAVVLCDNIYQSENVTSPFVLGFLRPIVYVPFMIDGQSLEHIIAHEQAHICRRDHIWKPLGFLLLTIHWFNPVMWLAYILLCRDIELACDEKVIKDLGNEQRADYSQALLDCSVNRRAIAACPLAFGEVGVKERVSSVLNYKKPAFWLIIAAVIVCAVVAVCFLTNPINAKIDAETEAYLHAVILEEGRSSHTDNYYPCEDHIILRVKENDGITTVYALVRYGEYSFVNGELREETGFHMPCVITLDMQGYGYSAVCRWSEDGTRYVPSIKEMFPPLLRNKAIKIHLYSSEQTERCIEQAKKHFLSSGIGEINFSTEVPDMEFPLEGDYLTLHQALYCIEYARESIYSARQESEEAEMVFCFPYSSHSTGECTYFGNGSPCNEWKENPMHPYPFHSDDEDFINCAPRPVWEICVSYPESEANATEIIYVDAQTGDMYNPTNRGGYSPSPFTEKSEYAHILAAGHNSIATTAPTTAPTTAAQIASSDDTLVLIREYLPNVYVDLKYASTDNFTGQVIYDFTEPSLRYGTVRKLYSAQQELLELGHSLKIWDAYRPFGAHEKLWNICPDPKYVSDPSSGNLSHCRGNAVDVTLVLADGSEIEMPTGFDDFSAKADRDYSDVSSAAKDNTLLLQRIMEKYGFKGYEGEWWHYVDTIDYAVVK